MGQRTVDCRSLRRKLQELVNRGYLKEFILNPGQPSETRVQKDAPEASQQEDQVSRTLIQYREVNTIFGASPIEGITAKEKAFYINEARRSIYPTMLTNSPLSSSRPISFSDADAMVVHFSHNDALIVIMIIGNCWMSKVLVNRGSFVNILYGGAWTGWRAPQRPHED